MHPTVARTVIPNSDPRNGVLDNCPKRTRARAPCNLRRPCV